MSINMVMGGLLFKNENLSEDIIDILKTLQDRYVPTIECDNTKRVLEQVFFGGDQLTEERARNAQRSLMDGDSLFDMLQGLVPKNEDWHAFRIAFEKIIKLLRKPESAGETGTYFCNATLTNNSNAKKDALNEYRFVREPFNLYVDVYIVSATLNYLGLSKIEDVQVPQTVADGNLLTQRIWLHGLVRKMVQKYVTLTEQVSDVQDKFQEVIQRPVFLCRAENCEHGPFVYKKARDNHEARKHSYIQPAENVESSKSDSKDSDDYIFNYGCLFMTLGLLLRNADDAVKEGDGPRIINMWRAFLLIYRKEGNTKYAVASLHLIALLKGILSPRDAHRLTWNRTVNRRGGKGKRVSNDFHLENLNLVLTNALKHLGVNLNESTAAREANALQYTKDIVTTFTGDLGIKKPKGYHKKLASEKDFITLLSEVHIKCQMFSFQIGREFRSFPKISRNVFSGLKVGSLKDWIVKWKKRWAEEQRLLNTVKN